MQTLGGPESPLAGTSKIRGSMQRGLGSSIYLGVSPHGERRAEMRALPRALGLGFLVWLLLYVVAIVIWVVAWAVRKRQGMELEAIAKEIPVE